MMTLTRRVGSPVYVFQTHEHSIIQTNTLMNRPGLLLALFEQMLKDYSAASS